MMRIFSYLFDNERQSKNNNIEQSLVIIKGDAISRSISGKIISKLEDKFSIIAMKTLTFNKDSVQHLYGGAKHLDFYPALIEYMMTGFHIAIVIEGENVIQRMLALKGKIAKQHDGDTLRNEFGIDDLISTIHCSHNVKDAHNEIRLFFKENEINKKIPETSKYLAISQARKPSEKIVLSYDKGKS